MMHKKILTLQNLELTNQGRDLEVMVMYESVCVAVRMSNQRRSSRSNPHLTMQFTG